MQSNQSTTKSAQSGRCKKVTSECVSHDMWWAIFIHTPLSYRTYVWLSNYYQNLSPKLKSFNTTWGIVMIGLSQYFQLHRSFVVKDYEIVYVLTLSTNDCKIILLFLPPLIAASSWLHRYEVFLLINHLFWHDRKDAVKFLEECLIGRRYDTLIVNEHSRTANRLYHWFYFNRHSSVTLDIWYSVYSDTTGVWYIELAQVCCGYARDCSSSVISNKPFFMVC